MSSTTALKPLSPENSSRIGVWASRLTAFAIGQGFVQMISLATGFLLIRWLTVTDYAIFSLVAGFQGTVGVLVELGLGTSILALLAGRKEPQIVGAYIRSTRHYRNRFLLWTAPLIIAAFCSLCVRQGMAPLLIVCLLGSILVSLYFQSWVTYYSVPLLVHQELRLYYRAPGMMGVARLLLSGALFGVGQLGSLAAVWLGTAATAIQGWIYRREASRHIIEPERSDPERNREVLSYIRPLIPSTIFFAIQGQITVLLVSWFGKVQNIAEVGALGRLGQLFVLLSAFNGVVIAPYVTTVSSVLLAKRYWQVVAGATAVSLALVGFCSLFPNQVLALLGQNYLHLRAELPWLLSSACLVYISGVLWTMNSARKWIFSWAVWGYISTVLLSQALGLMFLDLATTRGVIFMSVYTSVATLLVQVGWAFYGFSRERKSFKAL